MMYSQHGSFACASDSQFDGTKLNVIIVAIQKHHYYHIDCNFALNQNQNASYGENFDKIIVETVTMQISGG